jgi:hypothetical protein
MQPNVRTYNPRARPRSASTIYVYFGSVRPFLERWATRYDHLREVTPAEIGAALEPLNGSKRSNCHQRPALAASLRNGA